ncbi:hypothetical protein D9M68_899260 [compost metagenome]
MNWRTLRPTRITTPATSWPSTNGARYGRMSLNSPSRILESSRFTAVACTSISTSSSRTSGSGMSAARSGPFFP